MQTLTRSISAAIVLVLLVIQHALSRMLASAPNSKKNDSQRSMERALGMAADSTLALLQPSNDVWAMMAMEKPEDMQRLREVTAVFLEVSTQHYCRGY